MHFSQDICQNPDFGPNLRLNWSNLYVQRFFIIIVNQYVISAKTNDYKLMFIKGYSNARRNK